MLFFRRDSRVAVEGSSEATVAAPSSPTASSPTLTGAVSPVIEAVMKVNELVLTSNGAEADKYLRLLIEHLEKYTSLSSSSSDTHQWHSDGCDLSDPRQL